MAWTEQLNNKQIKSLINDTCPTCETKTLEPVSSSGRTVNCSKCNCAYIKPADVNMVKKSDILEYLELKMKNDGYLKTAEPLHLMNKYGIPQGAASDYLKMWHKWRLDIIHNQPTSYEEKEKALNNFSDL